MCEWLDQDYITSYLYQELAQNCLDSFIVIWSSSLFISINYGHATIFSCIFNWTRSS